VGAREWLSIGAAIGMPLHSLQSSRVIHGASKRKWDLQTTHDMLKGIQK